ncbi:tetratricopeptide repeat protein [bacterium]|nr:tetratricopeptide repeat protein [bacterium]MBU1983360.1 tetratricopeptide repeat protein [bacterium]
MSPSPSSHDTRFLRWALLLAAIFAAVRVIFLYQISGTPLLKLPILDSEFYYSWAVRLARGFGHPDGPFWLSPLYPSFLAGVFKGMNSYSTGLIAALQGIISIGTLAAMVYYTRVLFGNAVALITAGLAALYAPWLYYDGVLLSGSLILFLNAVLLLLLITRSGLSVERDSTADVSPVARDAVWVAIGLLCGLSALARPSVLIFVAIVAIWLLRRRSPGRGRQLVFFVGAIAILIAPVLIRNLRVSGSLLLTTSSGGVNFFIGNRAGATGVYDEFNFVESFDPIREAEGFRAEASNRTGRELSLDEASRYWAGQAADDVVRNPGGWLRLLLRKLWFTVQREEIATNVSFRGAAGFAPILGALPVRWGLLFPFAVAGALLGWRRRKELRLLGLYAASYLAVNLIFFSASEYRLPMILVLFPAAGCFFMEIGRSVAAQDFRRLALGCGAYLVMLIVCNAPSPFIARTVKPTTDYYNMAVGLVNQGELVDAIPLFARSLTVDPDYRPARRGLADALWALGNYDDARREYQALSEPAPDEISGSPLQQFLDQLWFYTEEDDYAGALEYLNEHFPKDSAAPPEIWVNRAMVEAGLGRYDDAIASLEKGWAMEPDSPDWPYKAGIMAIEAKDSVRADSFFTKAIERYPAYAPARLKKARLALARGDSLAARVQLDELRKIRIPEDTVRWQVWNLALDLGEVIQTENE